MFVNTPLKRCAHRLCRLTNGGAEVRVDKIIDLTIKNGIRITYLVIRAMIFNSLVRVQYVGTDLAAPLCFDMLALDFGDLFLLLAVLNRVNALARPAWHSLCFGNND